MVLNDALPNAQSSPRRIIRIVKVFILDNLRDAQPDVHVHPSHSRRIMSIQYKNDHFVYSSTSNTCILLCFGCKIPPQIKLEENPLKYKIHVLQRWRQCLVPGHHLATFLKCATNVKMPMHSNYSDFVLQRKLNGNYTTKITDLWKPPIIQMIPLDGLTCFLLLAVSSSPASMIDLFCYLLNCCER